MTSLHALNVSSMLGGVFLFLSATRNHEVFAL